MTRDDDPPRLRTLSSELPDELLLALQDKPEDEATPAQLAELTRRVERALQQHEDTRKRARRFVRVPTARGRVAAVAFTFTLGAAAGVLGSSGVFLVLGKSSAEPRAPVSVAPATLAAPQGPLRMAAPRVSATPEPTAEDAVPSARAATREAARLPTRERTAEPAFDPPLPPAAGARDEFALIARAQAALAKNPGSALALASDHERKFPNGSLVQERELIAIDALVRLARRTEATGRAARFHRQFPGSVHGRRVDVLLGNGEPRASDRD